jgi:NhaP-type Na+/H+ or K+/H+ antiporter
MRVVIAFGVFAIGVDLPKAYMWRHAKGMAFLVVPVMFWGWILCAGMFSSPPSNLFISMLSISALGLVYALFPGLNYLSALVVSATLTPTDPVGETWLFFRRILIIDICSLIKVLSAAIVGGYYAEK